MIVQAVGHKDLTSDGTFKLVEHRWPDAGVPEFAMVGESATAIGWIPFYGHADQLDGGFLKDAWNTPNSSVPLLLKSGNRTPNDAFRGPVDLQRFIALHDFRAAISIDQPTLFLDAKGDPTLLQFLALAEAGTTPFRAEYLISPCAWHSYYSGGDAWAAGEISTDPNRVTIRLFLRMRIGWLGRLVAKFQTGYWPPWAIAMVEFEFQYREPYSSHISFHGSAVPSQRQYVDWKRVSDYQMEYQMSKAAYEGFLKTDGMDAQYRRLDRQGRLLKIRRISVDDLFESDPSSDKNFGGSSK